MSDFFDCCRESIGNAKERILTLWESGPKGKAACILCAAFLLWIGSCVFVGGSGKIRFDQVSADPFSTIFLTKMPGEESGVAYRHNGNSDVQVIGVDKEGIFVAYAGGARLDDEGYEHHISKLDGDMDQVVYVSTDPTGYADGTPLRDGYYVRNGTHKYQRFGEIKQSIPRFVELRDSRSRKKCRTLEKSRTTRNSVPPNDQ